jgi:general stress protein 26
MTDTRPSDDAARFDELVSDIRVAMLTTPDETGTLQGRPLTVQRVDEDGTVWFLVDADAHWVQTRFPAVNVAFGDASTWVSASGAAEVVEDPAVLDELGDPVSDAWFEEGATPAALRVDVSRADYWDAPGRVVQLAKLGKAALTGSAPDMGERGVVEP